MPICARQQQRWQATVAAHIGSARGLQRQPTTLCNQRQSRRHPWASA